MCIKMVLTFIFDSTEFCHFLKMFISNMVIVTETALLYFVYFIRYYFSFASSLLRVFFVLLDLQETYLNSMECDFIITIIIREISMSANFGVAKFG